MLQSTGNILTMATYTALPVTVRRQLKVWPFRQCSPFRDNYPRFQHHCQSLRLWYVFFVTTWRRGHFAKCENDGLRFPQAELEFLKLKFDLKL